MPSVNKLALCCWRDQPSQANISFKQVKTQLTRESLNKSHLKETATCKMTQTTQPSPRMNSEKKQKSTTDDNNKFFKRLSKMRVKLRVKTWSCLLLMLASKFLASCSQDSEAGAFVSASSDSAPRITIQPNDLIAIEGESAELNCDAEGQPEPTIEWYHNGQLIKASSNSRTTMGGSIQFLDIRPTTTKLQLQHTSDTGVYFCLAKNALGQARSRNASLQVACKY